MLIACAFNYEAHATEFSKLGRIPVLKARMNADLHMAEDLGVPTWRQGAESASASAQEEAMRQPKYPAGWDEERVRCVLEYYETQSEEEAVAEDEAAYEAITHTAMEVPVGLVPVVRELTARQRAG